MIIQEEKPQQVETLLRNGGVLMPAVGKNWSDAQIDALVAYTKTLGGAGGGSG